MECLEAKRRKIRNIGMYCIDSRDEENITEEEKEQRIKELFNANKVAERVKNIEFYDQLFKVSERISRVSYSLQRKKPSISNSFFVG